MVLTVEWQGRGKVLTDLICVALRCGTVRSPCERRGKAGCPYHATEGAEGSGILRVSKPWSAETVGNAWVWWPLSMPIVHSPWRQMSKWGLSTNHREREWHQWIPSLINQPYGAFSICNSKLLGLYNNHTVWLFISQVLSIMREALERVAYEQESKRVSMGVVLLKTGWKIKVCSLLHEKMKQEGKQFVKRCYLWTVLNNMNHGASNPVWWPCASRVHHLPGDYKFMHALYSELKKMFSKVRTCCVGITLHLK